jgi:hypothetical protein
MPTTRSITAERPGRIALDLYLPAGRINVTVDPECRRAVLVLSTPDETGPSADAVNDAYLDHTGQTLTVGVPNLPDTTTTVTHTGHVRIVSMNATANHGSTVIQSGGDVWVNGRRVTGGTAPAGPSEVVAAARLPIGSCLTARTRSGEVITRGALVLAEVTTVSGDIDLDTVTSAQAHSVSGSIEVAGLAGTAELESTSGDITVRTVAPSQLTARCVSGDITVHATAATTLTARTTSGDVRVSGPVRLDGRSVSGRVRQH